ncbi:MAG TPA: hypothetical protein VK009_29110 [Chloroflexota bacterium]|nr:hypothetical protein [Chloroflexota bacterium]
MCGDRVALIVHGIAVCSRHGSAIAERLGRHGVSLAELTGTEVQALVDELASAGGNRRR